MFARRDAISKGLKRIIEVRLREHRLVGGRRGAKVGDTVLHDLFDELWRSRLLDCRRRSAEAQWKHERDPEPESEGDRRARQEDVAGPGPDKMRRERVAWREHIAVELHAALGDSGRAAGEGDQRWVIPPGIDRRQRPVRAGSSFKLAKSVIAVILDDVPDTLRLLDRLTEVTDEAAVDDRVGNLRPFDDRSDLTGTQQRHGRDHD